MSKGKRGFSTEFGSGDYIDYESFFPSGQHYKKFSVQVPMDEDVPMGQARFNRRKPYPRAISRFISKPTYVRKWNARRQVNRRFPLRVGGWPKPISRTEFKYVDSGFINLASDSGGAIALLNGCAEGVGPSQHIGRKTQMKSIELKMINRSTPATGVDQMFRVLVVYDRQPNGVALQIADVLTAINVQTMRNLDNRMRFLILMDKQGSVNASGESFSENAWTWYKKVNLPVVYDATADATIASISTGSLYLIAIGNIGAGATAGTCQGYARVRYTDA